jgi:hypothetical protein
MITTTRGAILVGLLAPLFAAGCFSPNSVACGDGRICPPESRCDEQRHRCITNAQMLSCAGQTENEGCTFANAPGACRAGVCELFACGDGIIEAELRESCDGAPPPGKSCLDYGFDRGFLGCTATCELSFEKCGSFSWTNWSIPGAGDWTGVWASGPSDVYVVGTGILHWDGSNWSTGPMMQSGFTDVWGSGPNDVYAVGSGVLAHWDGAGWSIWDGLRWRAAQEAGAGPAGLGSFESVWGSGPDDVYAVGSGWDPNGQGGLMLHWNGQSWSQVADPVLQTASDLNSVWGTGPGDVFVAGAVLDPVPNGDGYPTYHHVVFHWDGSRWSNVFTPDGAVFYGFAGSGRNDVFAVGFSSDGSAARGATAHWDGTSWSTMAPAPEPLTAAWAGGGEVLAVGWSGAVFKWDGGSWATVQAGNANATPGSNPVGGIYGTGGNVFTVGPGATDFRRDSSAWSAVTSDVSGRAVWAGAPDDAVAVGFQGISHWDGTRWASVWTSVGGGAWLDAVWGSGARDVFAVGGAGLVVHWDGTAWSTSTAGSESCSVGPTGPSMGKAGSGGGAGSGGSTGSGGAAGSTGASSGSQGSSSPPLCDLVSVWGSGASEVFAVSRPLTDQGQSDLVHWDGTTWSTLSVSPHPVQVSELWASGPNDLYLVGGEGSIYHWDGTVLSPTYTDNSGGLSSVWGSGPDDVFAVGGVARYLHWDGVRWTAEIPSTGAVFSAVRGSGAGDVFAIGDGGGLFHFRSGDWEPIRLPGIWAFGLSVTPARVFVVGYSGEAHLDRSSVTCVAPESDCNDGWDNDCDGLPDGADPDCAGKVSEQCADLVDDDGDGKIDCADPDCAEFPSCKGPRFEQCDDLVDNDGDGKIDCADPDCAEFPSCKGVGGADGGAGGKGGVADAGAPPLGTGGVGGAAPPPPTDGGAPPLGTGGVGGGAPPPP